MSKIFELFGYRLDRWDQKAQDNLSKAWCPHMDMECDGGGNRYLSAIDLTKKPILAKYFPGKNKVQCGVCSLILRDGDQPWIVCPRRLLAIRDGQVSKHQNLVRDELRLKIRYSENGSRFKVWSEVKMKVDTSNDDEEQKSFDYTFDYIITKVGRVELARLAEMAHLTVKQVSKLAQKNGYTLGVENGVVYVDDFPTDPVTIIEVMTSSTSGGDKEKRSQIAMALEDAVLDPECHQGPGINYRQVWARMVSQLIVKSQVATAWGGLTIWVLQDVLTDYISMSTALDLKKYVSELLDEVNILSFGYGDYAAEPKGSILPMKESSLYAGPISTATEKDTSGFIDIIKIGAPPEKDQLWYSLLKKRAIGYLNL